MRRGNAVAAFDRLASRYDAWYATPLGAFVDAREKEAVFGLAGVQPGERALDVGCGTGNYTLSLATRGAKAVGVDPAPAMLAIATRKAREAGLPARFAQAIAENLPFPAGSFDLVVSVTTLEFVVSPEAAVAEMVRVLRPGGRLVVGVLNAWSLWALVYRWRTGSVYEHANFFSPSELVGLLQPYGRVTWSSCVFLPPWHAGNIGPPALALERVGSRWLRPFGAFLAARVR